MIAALRAGCRRVRFTVATGAKARVTERLEKAGIFRMIGRENFCANILEALAARGVQPGAGAESPVTKEDPR